MHFFSTNKPKSRNRTPSSCSIDRSPRSASRCRGDTYYFHMSSPHLGDWPEVEVAGLENRKELVIGPAKADDPLKRSATIGGIPDDVYVLEQLNYLEVHNLPQFTSVSPKIGGMTNLTKLVLCNNGLTSLPVELAHLTKLKALDVSANQLCGELIEEIGRLTNLNDLNVSQNKLTGLPSLCALESLIHLNISSNELTVLPHSVMTANHKMMSVLNAKYNKITTIPGDISNLAATLKSFNCTNNQLMHICKELGSCTKLKEVALSGNAVKDRRLFKMLNDAHPKVPAIMDYIRKNCTSAGQTAVVPSQRRRSRSRSKASRKKTTSESESNGVTVTSKPRVEIVIVNKNDEIRITKTDLVDQCRPHLACCVVRSLRFDVGDRFKKFLDLQNRIHDVDCKKRCSATIATHDLNKCRLPLQYTAKPPAELIIHPLRAAEPLNAIELVASLTRDAETARKREKKNTFSSTYKYVALVKDMTVYPCLLDANGTALSFAPITNSEVSKMTMDTRDLLIEVTSGESAAVCRRVLDRLVVEMALMRLCDGPDDQGDQPAVSMIVEQVKVITSEGAVRVAYPDRHDLDSPLLEVSREQKK